MNKTGNHNLKKQEINIYREIQRNTEMAMKALDAVTDKIYDDRLAAVGCDCGRPGAAIFQTA